MTAHTAHLAHRERLRMATTVDITRPGAGDPVFNPDTGNYDPPPAVDVYTGRALIRPAMRQGQDVDYGGTEVALSSYTVTLPLEVAPKSGDTISVTASPDPELTGLALTVDVVFVDSTPINRRLLAERAT